MKGYFNISFRHGGNRVYACDINSYVWDKREGYYKSSRIASVPVELDYRQDNFPVPSYAVKLKKWHEARKEAA